MKYEYDSKNAQLRYKLDISSYLCDFTAIDFPFFTADAKTVYWVNLAFDFKGKAMKGKMYSVLDKKQTDITAKDAFLIAGTPKVEIKVDKSTTYTATVEFVVNYDLGKIKVTKLA